MPTIAPYGSWRSPISAALVASANVGLSQVMRDADQLYWVEQRPAESGRNVVVRRSPDGATADVIPPPFNARTRVHEYGGGAYAVAEGVVYFANFADQRLWRARPGEVPEALTAEGPFRYADLEIDDRRALIYCVREDHADPTREPLNTLVQVSMRDGEVRVIAEGYDFYASPRRSRDGRQLAWLAWRHPHMPWDSTELFVADVRDDGTLGEARLIAGGPAESVQQPMWAPDNALWLISDRSGWWNLYRLDGDSLEPICQMAAEFGVPAWVFGQTTYGFVDDRAVLVAYHEPGRWRLGLVDATSAQLVPLDTPYSSVSSLCTAGGRTWFVGASPTESPAIVELDIARGATSVLHRAGGTRIDPGYLSQPRLIEFASGNGQTAYAFYYVPANSDFQAPAGELSPLLVMCHGGPTSATSTALRLSIQYWTSRGIGVLDVDYGGSTGYGRAYRERLRGNWGIVDVDDCTNGARHLARLGEVDGDRLAMTGGSAGGYTTLAALTFRDVFKAGASHYGIGDLSALADDTHKFESRYLDSLVGPYPDCRDLYEERSPLQHVDRLATPAIFFQGMDDKIVPPDQAERMVAALRARGVPVAYLPFEGEQHGFRRAENIQRALEAELYFYSRIFGFELADSVAPVAIENLSDA
ncbi:MAG: hypothetical protein QOF51_4042 [Chloroflexota bacterium]|jgi:dipeptidyl aminopeptidase/acylaminoacyl peptidase|nr:hypothetical protein [Chloroflexota bacterium]